MKKDEQPKKQLADPGNSNKGNQTKEKRTEVVTAQTTATPGQADQPSKQTEQKEQKSQEQKQQAQPDPEMAAQLKEMETAMFAIRFYPVAVNEQAKNEALEKLERIYAKGNDTIKQMFLYMVHEMLATSNDLKLVHTAEYFKMKNPTLEPSQQRINVYRAMFNYNTSLEGLIEIIRLLGRLKGDDAAKLVTYHFSHLCAYENEANHMLRAAMLEALGKSETKYALLALLTYARYTDNERTFNRIVSALTEWEGRLEKFKMPEKEKEQIRQKLKEIVTSEFGGSHYG